MAWKQDMQYWNLKTYKDFHKFAEPTMFSEQREDGIFNIRLKNWRLLDPILYTMIEMSHAVFRGVQKCTFTLEPSIFRRYVFKTMTSIDERNDYICRCYSHFIEAIRGRRGPLSKPLDSYNKYELWSLGRHFGVKNTMLDWSHSPYICLFFAFSNWSDEGVRSLFCLKRNIIEDVRKAVYRTQKQDDIILTEELDYDSLLFYIPLSDDNFRMINQQGLFTVSRNPHTIEEWVSANYGTIRLFLDDKYRQERDEKKKETLRTEINSGWILLKIDIETDQRDRRQILKQLNRMNINYATLFPDIEGASLYANMQGDIHHY
jgi:hypothetical protein